MNKRGLGKIKLELMGKIKFLKKPLDAMKQKRLRVRAA